MLAPPKAARRGPALLRLKLHLPPSAPEGGPGSARWLINGFPAAVLIWTAEEWARLTDRPGDAQPYPNGIWCVIRME